MISIKKEKHEIEWEIYEIEWEEVGSSSTFEPIENFTQFNDILQAYLHLKNKTKVNIFNLKYHIKSRVGSSNKTNLQDYVYGLLFKII